jgi:two-component system, sensor histidine kinase and response regulator
MAISGENSRILLVDDTMENIQVAGELLRGKGYQVSVARDGTQALTVCEKSNPDLILLDIMMPEMDGYECCRKLKADEAKKDIPVIFLSAMTETTDIVKGFEIGAVDYVTKPFNAAELLARVATHLHQRKLQVTVEDNYRNLKELEGIRDSLVHMIIHDMRTPLTVVDGNLDLVTMMVSKMTGYDEFADCLRDARQGTRDVIGMVSNLLDVSRMEDGKMPLNPRPHDLGEMLEQCGRTVAVKARQHQVEFTVEARPATTRCDGELIQRVLVNLAANAIKFSTPTTSVRLQNSAAGDTLTVSVLDTGPGVPAEYQEKVFEKFGQVDAHKDRKKFSTGLGLTFCKMAVEAHGGKIGVESDGENGSTFWFTLPMKN